MTLLLRVHEETGPCRTMTIRETRRLVHRGVVETADLNRLRLVGQRGTSPARLIHVMLDLRGVVRPVRLLVPVLDVRLPMLVDRGRARTRTRDLPRLRLDAVVRLRLVLLSLVLLPPDEAGHLRLMTTLVAEKGRLRLRLLAIVVPRARGDVLARLLTRR